jgi:hypothetical protein
VPETFVSSLQNSRRHASQELAISQAMMWKIVRKCSQVKCYKFKILQQLKPDDNVKHATFCAEMMGNISVEDHFLSNIVFRYEAMFLLSGSVSHHSMQMWSLGNHHKTIEHARHTPKVNLFCSLSTNGV